MGIVQAETWVARFTDNTELPLVAWVQAQSGRVYGLVVGPTGRLTSAESLGGFQGYEGARKASA